MEVNRASAVPPYQQVAAILRERIASGQIPPGGALPSVSQLTQEFGIARLTASKAQRVLVAEGLAYVVVGWGTFAVD